MKSKTTMVAVVVSHLSPHTVNKTVAHLQQRKWCTHIYIHKHTGDNAMKMVNRDKIRARPQQIKPFHQSKVHFVSLCSIFIVVSFHCVDWAFEYAQAIQVVPFTASVFMSVLLCVLLSLHSHFGIHFIWHLIRLRALSFIHFYYVLFWYVNRLQIA